MKSASIRVGLSCLVALLAVACGDNGGGENPDASTTDTMRGEVDQPPATCTEATEGEACDDGDPCHQGQGTCLLGECYYEAEQVYSCNTPPDDCSTDGQCDGEGGCTWDLADGWCRIGGECISEGQAKPDNECRKCLPDENRGGWSPVTGDSCTPADNPCTTQGTCELGFCVAVASGDECATDADCLPLDDGNLCNGGWVCEACQCVEDLSSAVVCDSVDDSDCVLNDCNPDTGECELTPLSDGTECDDDDPCTAGDYCLGGECISGETAPPVWTPVKPINTAYITSIRFIGTQTPTLYAVGSGGVVYRSADMGQTFQQSDIVAPGGDLGDWLHVAGQSPTHILALFGDALVVSNDTGFNYATKMTGCTTLAGAVSAQGTYFATCNKQVYLSTDYGANWQNVGSVPGSGSGVAAGLAAVDGQTLYLGTRDEDGQGRGYVHRSTDGGQTWGQVDPPDRPDLAQVSHRGLFISPTAPDRLFMGYTNSAGNAFQFGSQPLWRSEDGGSSWAALNANTTGTAWVPLALDSAGRLLLGVDTGISRGGAFGNGPWGKIPPPTQPSEILFHTITSATTQPGNDFAFVVPVGNGVAHATDLGAQWSLLRNGLDGGAFAQVSACADGQTFVAQERFSSGLYRTSDGGASWELLPVPEAAVGQEVTALECSPADPNVFYGYTAQGGFLTSKNGGQTVNYQTEMDGPVLASLNALAHVPQSPNRLLVSRLGMGLFESQDAAAPQGAGFQPLALPEAYVASVVADPAQNGRYYVGTYVTQETPRARVYVCTDFGQSCTVKLQSDPVDGDVDRVGFRIFADQHLTGRVYAAVNGSSPRIHYSNDHGDSWQTFVDLPLLSTRGLGAILPDRDSEGSLLAAFWLHGLARWDEVDQAWARQDEAPDGLVSLAYEPVEGGNILAGSGLEARVWESDDNGATWSLEKDFSLSGYAVKHLVAEGAHLFALLQGKNPAEAKLFVRDGNTWKESVVGTAVADVAVQPLPENEQVLAAGRFGGLYMSNDGGLSFAAYGNLDSAAHDLLVSPADPEVVFAAVACGTLPAWFDPAESFLGSDCGVRRSIDGGETWFTVLNANKPCTSLAVSPANPDILLTTCPGSGAYVTTDGGSSWNPVTGWTWLTGANVVTISQGFAWFGTQGRGIARVVFDPATGSFGSWKGTFSDAVRDLRPVRTIRMAVHPDSPSRVVVAAQPGGLLRTDDFGENWQLVSPAVGPEPDALAADAVLPPAVPRFVESPEGWELWLAVAGRGIFRSRDHGFRYTFLTGNSLQVSTAHPVDLIFDEDYPDLVFLAAREGVFRTPDLGGQWLKLEVGLPQGAVQAITPPVNNAIYVSVAGSGLYSVPFDGASWTRMHAVDVSGSVAQAWDGRRLGLWHFASPDPDSAQTVLVSTDPFGLFRTQDGGVTYRLVGTGLPAGPVWGLTRSPHDADLLVAGTPGGPYLSTDGGDTFAPASTGPGQPPGCTSFAFDGAAPETLYALCASTVPHGFPAQGKETEYGLRAFYRSVDGGATWEAVGSGLQSAKVPVQVVADPEMGGVVYVAALNGGVLRSADAGDSFAAWTTGLPAPQTGGHGMLHASPLAPAPDGSQAVLGTDGFSFYRRVLNAECE